jgi:MarR family transcriptional regulator, 2-MHQ and catechol-resistance regulon repressor
MAWGAKTMTSKPKQSFVDALESSGYNEKYSSLDTWTALRLWVSFSRTQAAIISREQLALAKHNLTRGEFAVLDALYFKGAMLLGDVKRKILVTSAGMTYLIDRLEKRGLVERRPSPEDRRAVFASLTPEGERYFKEIFPEHFYGLTEPLSVLSHEEQTELKKLIEKLGFKAEELLKADMGKQASKRK